MKLPLGNKSKASEGGPGEQPAASRRSAGAICEPAATKRRHATSCCHKHRGMQLTLRRRFRVALLGMAVLLLLAGRYAKQVMDAAELELASERETTAHNMGALQLALDDATAKVEALQRFPPAVAQPALPAPAPAPPVPLSTPTLPPPPPGAADVPAISPPSQPQPTVARRSAGSAVEDVLRYIDTRSQPPADALTIVVMGSHQMMHRDKTFYLDAFKAIGYHTVEIGDASDPLIPWHPSGTGWAGQMLQPTHHCVAFSTKRPSIALAYMYWLKLADFR